MTQHLLQAERLVKHYPLRAGLLSRKSGAVRAVDGVSFALAPRETLGLVGESGCGKTTVARLVLRLEKPSAGRVLFDGQDLFALSSQALRAKRRELQIVFQDPMSSLNPRMMVGEILAEPLRVHRVAGLFLLAYWLYIDGVDTSSSCSSGFMGRGTRSSRPGWNRTCSGCATGSSVIETMARSSVCPRLLTRPAARPPRRSCLGLPPR